MKKLKTRLEKYLTSEGVDHTGVFFVPSNRFVSSGLKKDEEGEVDYLTIIDQEGTILLENEEVKSIDNIRLIIDENSQIKELNREQVFKIKKHMNMVKNTSGQSYCSFCDGNDVMKAFKEG